MDANSLIVLYLCVWLGILLCLAGLVVWWGVFKIPAEHVGLARSKRLYSAGWHFHVYGRFIRIVLIDLAGIHRRITEEINATLKGLLGSINAVTDKMPFSFQADFQADVQDFIDNNREGLLLGAAHTEQLIAKVTAQLTRDLTELEKANVSYQKALKVYNESKVEIFKADRLTLENELELDYRALTSQNLETLLQLRKWDAFLDIVESIAKHLEVIKQKAIRIQRGGDTETRPDVEGRREKAYRILGVSPTTTKNEIEKMLRHLRKAYHPDSVVDEEKKSTLENKLKEIEWAANVLEVKPMSPTN